MDSNNMNVTLDNANGRIEVSVNVEQEDGIRYVRLNGTHVVPGRSVRSDSWRAVKAAAVVTFGSRGGRFQTWNTVVSIEGVKHSAPVQFGAVDGVLQAAAAALLSAVSGVSHFPVA